MTGSVDFWFEFASTYSYLSAMRVDEEAARRGVAVRWRPLLLGPILGAQGLKTSPFKAFPAKGAYMWRDMERRAEKFGLPFRRPSPEGMEAFPQNSLLAARAALVALGQPWGRAYCRNVYAAEWAEGRSIEDLAVLGEAIAAAGGDPEATLAAAVEDANKARLRADMAEAQALGLIGAPSFVAAGEVFWGDDRLEDALDWAAASA